MPLSNIKILSVVVTTYLLQIGAQTIIHHNNLQSNIALKKEQENFLQHLYNIYTAQ